MSGYDTTWEYTDPTVQEHPGLGGSEIGNLLKSLDITSLNFAQFAAGNRATKIAGLVVAFLLATGLAFGLSSASGSAVGTLVASHSESCITPDRNAFTPNNAKALQVTCEGAEDQMFEIRDVGDGLVELYNRGTGLCLHVENAVDQSGGPFLQTGCNRSRNSVFKAESINGAYSFVVQHTGMCLEVAGAGVGQRDPLVQGGCTGGPHQLFRHDTQVEETTPTTRPVVNVTTTTAGGGGTTVTVPQSTGGSGGYDYAKPDGFVAVPRPASVRLDGGSLSIGTGNRVIYGSDAVSRLAELHTADIAQVHGVALSAPAAGQSPGQGDVFLNLVDDLTGEDYRITVDGSAVKIEAGTYDGLAFAIMTALQSYSADGSGLVIGQMSVTDTPDIGYRSYQVTTKVNGNVSDVNYYGLDNLKSHVDLARMYKVRYMHFHTTEAQWMLGALERSNSVSPELLRSNNLYSKAEWDELIRYAADRGVHLYPHNESTSWFSGMAHALVDNGGTDFNVIEELYRATGTSLGNGLDGRVSADGEGKIAPDDPDYDKAIELFTRLSYRQFAAGYADGKVPYYHIGPVYGEGGTSPDEMLKILGALRQEDADVKVMFWSGVNPDDPVIQQHKDDVVLALYSPNDYNQPMQNHVDAGLTVINAAWRPHYITPGHKKSPQHIYENSNLLREGNDGIARPLEYLMSNPSDLILGGLISQWDFSVASQDQLGLARTRVGPWADRYWNYQPFSEYTPSDFANMEPSFNAVDQMTTRLMGQAVLPSGSQKGPLVVNNSDKCVVVSDEGRMVLAPCDGSAGQNWELRPVDEDDTFAQIAQPGVDNCVHVEGGSGDDGRGMLIGTCEYKGVNEQFKFVSAGGQAVLTTRHSSKCLTVEGSIADGAAVVQMPCTGEASQVLSFGKSATTPVVVTPNPGGGSPAAVTGSGGIRTADGRCLGISGGSTGQEAELVAEDCNGSDSQSFEFRAVDGKTEVLVKHSGLCLHVRDASTADGAEIVQTACDQRRNSLWTIDDGSATAMRAEHSGKCVAVSGNAVRQQNCGGDGQQLSIDRGSSSPPTTPPTTTNPAPGGSGSSALSPVHAPDLCVGIEDFYLTLQTCSGADQQAFELRPAVDGFSELAIVGAPSCMHIEYNSDDDGRRILANDCGLNQDNALWRLSSNGELIAKSSGKCAAVEGGSRDAGATIIQQSCSGAAHQKFSGLGAKVSKPRPVSSPPTASPPGAPKVLVVPKTTPPSTPTAGSASVSYQGKKPFRTFADGDIMQDAWVSDDIAFYAAAGRVSQDVAEQWVGWYEQADDRYRVVSGRADFDSVFRANDPNFGSKKVLGVVDGPNNSCGTVNAAGCGSKQQAQAAQGYLDRMLTDPDDFQEHWIFFYEMGRGGAPEPWYGRATWPTNTVVLPHLMAGIAYHDIGGPSALKDMTGEGVRTIPGDLYAEFKRWEQDDKEWVDHFRASDEQSVDGYSSHHLMAGMMWEIMMENDVNTLARVTGNMATKPEPSSAQQAMCDFQEAVNDATGGRYSSRMKGQWGLPDQC